MASTPDTNLDSVPSDVETSADGFEPGLGGSGTDARGEGESPYPPIEDAPPAEDQPMPAEDQPSPSEDSVTS